MVQRKKISDIPDFGSTTTTMNVWFKGDVNDLKTISDIIWVMSLPFSDGRKLSPLWQTVQSSLSVDPDMNKDRSIPIVRNISMGSFHIHIQSTSAVVAIIGVLLSFTTEQERIEIRGRAARSITEYSHQVERDFRQRNRSMGKRIDNLRRSIASLLIEIE